MMKSVDIKKLDATSEERDLELLALLAQIDVAEAQLAQVDVREVR